MERGEFVVARLVLGAQRQSVAGVELGREMGPGARRRGVWRVELRLRFGVRGSMTERKGRGGKVVKGEDEKKRQKICMWRGVGAWGCMRFPWRFAGSKKCRKTRAMVWRARQ